MNVSGVASVKGYKILIGTFYLVKHLVEKNNIEGLDYLTNEMKRIKGAWIYIPFNDWKKIEGKNYYYNTMVKISGYFFGNPIKPDGVAEIVTQNESISLTVCNPRGVVIAINEIYLCNDTKKVPMTPVEAYPFWVSVEPFTKTIVFQYPCIWLVEKGYHGKYWFEITAELRDDEGRMVCPEFLFQSNEFEVEGW